jgi:hypothetical protein
MSAPRECIQCYEEIEDGQPFIDLGRDLFNEAQLLHKDCEDAFQNRCERNAEDLDAEYYGGSGGTDYSSDAMAAMQRKYDK